MKELIISSLFILNISVILSAQTHTVPFSGDSLHMVWIPPGTFYLGSSQEEKEWAISEGKCGKEQVEREGDSVRLAKIKDGFWIGRYELTFGQFSTYVKQTNYISDGEKEGRIYTYSPDLKKWAFVENKSWKDPNFGFPMKNDYPVLSVSWNDAIAFCNWLTEMENKAGNLPKGFEYRLPTEAEWEYACRGGSEKTKFWWGDEISDALGRINASGPDTINQMTSEICPDRGFPYTDGFAFCSPVGYFGKRGQNAYGLSDMIGNVYEWVMDKYDNTGASETVALSSENTMRLIKGGAFTSPPGLYRIAARGPWAPDTGCGQIGFRIVLGKQLSSN